MRYVFKMVKKVQGANDVQINGTGDASDDYIGTGDDHVMIFDMGDVADFNVSAVVLDKGHSKGQNGRSFAGYRPSAADARIRHVKFSHRYRYFWKCSLPGKDPAEVGTYGRG